MSNPMMKMLTMVAALFLVPCAGARDVHSTAHPPVSKEWGGTMPTTGRLINLIGDPTGTAPNSDWRAYGVEICNRSSTAAEVVSVRFNATTTGSVDWDSLDGEQDPTIYPGGPSGGCRLFAEQLIWQMELQSASGTPLVTATWQRDLE